MAPGAVPSDDRGGQLMGYLARLMSETGLGTTTLPRPSPVARLDVDVIRESGPTHSTPSGVAVGVVPDQRLAPTVEALVAEPAAERPVSPPTPVPSVSAVVPDAQLGSVDPRPTPAPRIVVETIESTIVAATPEPVRRVEVDRSVLTSTIEPTDRLADRVATVSGEVATVSRETAGRAGDPPPETRAITPVASETFPLSVPVTHTPDPAAPFSGVVMDEGQWLRGGLVERDGPARGPELQSIALSIGSIEVVVEGPPTPATPTTPSTLTPAAPHLTVVDDLPRRLRRDYVTWPEGW
jgi:hypothetical protein